MLPQWAILFHVYMWSIKVRDKFVTMLSCQMMQETIGKFSSHFAVSLRRFPAKTDRASMWGLYVCVGVTHRFNEVIVHFYVAWVHISHCLWSREKNRVKLQILVSGGSRICQIKGCNLWKKCPLLNLSIPPYIILVIKKGRAMAPFNSSYAICQEQIITWQCTEKSWYISIVC